MKKIVIWLLITTSLSFANQTIKESEVVNFQNEAKKNFSSLKENRADISRFKYLKNKKDLNFVNQYVKDSFQGNDFLTKIEFEQVSQSVSKISKEINKERDFILYFTSTSVPKEALKNILFQVGLLQEDGFDIKTKQYLIGFPKDFKSYIFGFKDYIETLAPTVQKNVVDNVAIKVDPRFFNFFNLKKVPAIALATCKGLIPDFETCEFKYLLKGDTSLESFFEKVSQKNKDYQKQYESLLSHNF